MQVFFLLLLRQKQCGCRALVPFGSLFLTFLTFLHYLSCLLSNSILYLKHLDITFKESIKYRNTERVEALFQLSEKSNKIQKALKEALPKKKETTNLSQPNVVLLCKRERYRLFPHVTTWVICGYTCPTTLLYLRGQQ